MKTISDFSKASLAVFGVSSFLHEQGDDDVASCAYELSPSRIKSIGRTVFRIPVTKIRTTSKDSNNDDNNLTVGRYLTETCLLFFSK